jgi:threonine synthase
LSDRSHLGYQVLIGRNILKDVMVVDVSKQNIAPYVLPKATPISLGEGMTPLIQTPRLGAKLGLNRLYIKDE